MGLTCPNCQSPDVRPRNLAKRIGGTIGSLAGAASGASGILSAARVGMTVGAPAGPYTALAGAVCAATLRSIVGATIGCEIGTALGELVDEHILDSGTCRACGALVDPQDFHRPRRSHLSGIPHPGFAWQDGESGYEGWEHDERDEFDQEDDDHDGPSDRRGHADRGFRSGDRRRGHGRHREERGIDRHSGSSGRAPEFVGPPAKVPD